MDDAIEIHPKDWENVDFEDYFNDIDEHFTKMPEIAMPLLKCAKTTFMKIEKMIYSASSVLNAIKTSVPQEIFQ